VDPLALILIGAVDRRVGPALKLAAQLQEFEARAVHVAIDPLVTSRVAEDWIELGLSWLPLHIEDPRDEGLAACVCEVVEREARDRSRVIVLVPELDLGHWWHRVIHRGTARHLASRLQRLRRVTTVVIPYSLEDTSVFA
jgi:hypothetical protein